MKVLEKIRIDNITRSFVQETLTNTLSAVKFLRDQSNPFENKIGVKQGDDLSTDLFNSFLEKVDR